MKKLLGAFIVLVFIVLASAIGIGWYLNSAPDDATEERVSVSIVAGQNLETIANTLEESGTIRSALFLRLFSRVMGTEQSIQQGNYSLRKNMTTAEVHDFLVSGKQILVRVTIPEGYTVAKIAKLFAEKGITGEREFVSAASDPKLLEAHDLPGKSAQGFLYPDTYFFTENTLASDVVSHLLKTFVQKLDNAVPEWRSFDKDDVLEKIIIASIVEREYITPAEAPLMASVFYNRLRIGKALESCATVVYVMTEEYGKPHPQRLFFRDLEIASPFNTYKVTGLPPAAISNPGIVALKAAFEPAETDYLYFVLKGPAAQQHHFSKTFAEHNQASVFYLKG